jgi:hypothetical protein
MTQTLTTQHLTPEAIAVLVNHLPGYVKSALQAKSMELECPIEATIELAIASFLDQEAFSFEDCLLSQRLGDRV